MDRSEFSSFKELEAKLGRFVMAEFSLFNQKRIGVGWDLKVRAKYSCLMHRRPLEEEKKHFFYPSATARPGKK
jgi:hypothetical protein